MISAIRFYLDAFRQLLAMSEDSLVSDSARGLLSNADIIAEHGEVQELLALTGPATSEIL